MHILCDSEAVVHVLQNGGTRDCSLAAIARNIWLVMASFDFEIHVSHIAGRKNITADLLSHWNRTPHNTEKLQKLHFYPSMNGVMSHLVCYILIVIYSLFFVLFSSRFSLASAPLSPSLFKSDFGL